ncbi:MAG TPA: FG-GAP-like repeat-containing protein [Thermoanaerobaculia bacterium]|nr:FG-GAP-like repeat-containing protein [Thermoanaerobaculia bacterium]
MAITAPTQNPDVELWRHRNLGKAYYENPTTQLLAVAELKAALDLAPTSTREQLNYGLALLKAGKVEEGIAELETVQKADPAIPHTWFNLGVAYKKASDYDRTLVQFTRMVELVPDEPISRYNLGVLLALAGKPEAALVQFEKARALDPNLAAAHFQLYNAYKKAGRAADSARELSLFQELKRLQAGAAVPEDLDWSFYAELYDPAEARPHTGIAGIVGAASAPLRLVPERLAPPGTRDRESAFLVVLDFDGDGHPDLLAGSASGIRLFKDGRIPVKASGLEGLTGIVSVVPGDFDNDGLPDLCILAPGPRLFHNVKGHFVELKETLPPGPFGVFRAALFLDYDHDYDLDLFLFGDHPALLRNNGDGSWTDVTARFPFVPGKALAAAAIGVVADTPGVDLAVTYADRPGVVYRDRLAGRFEAEEVPALPAGARGLLAWDLDNDGWVDLAATGSTGPILLRNRTGIDGKGEGNARTGSWAALPSPPVSPGPPGPPAPIVLVDLENRGLGDLVAGDRAFLATGSGSFVTPGGLGSPLGVYPVALATADFDGDGRADLAAVGEDGAVFLLRNGTATPNRWLSVSLAGVKNLKLAATAEVEIKAGLSYQKRLYAGVPLLFGLGNHAEVDTVRITWPNGLIQNEPKQPAGKLGERRLYKEAQRLSGSCPMIFTWDGARFHFITDVLGVAPLGASLGDGEYFPVDHDEYVQIPGAALREVDGRYEVRITEELHEVTYLDQVRLFALDHPRESEIFTNDKFKGPPFPEFRLFGVRQRIYPVAATDDGGEDVLPRLLRVDGTYPDGFRRDFTGVAEPHTLTLDFGTAAPDGKAVLFLTGWVDWADGSTFLGAAQATRGGRAGGLQMPQLQVKDAAGRWQTVIEDMGIPSGKPKTISVDLTGKFLSASREVRIVTNVCVYWDEIFVATGAADPEVRLTPVDPAAADLHFRGFSTPLIHPERKQPEAFDYGLLLALPTWNPTPGLYTRYGDVRPLLSAADDRLVLLGSGDEVRLLFPAASLPPLPPGWRRDFLLLVDGWAKDADPNTAFSQSVEPLPFHAMSRYPYPNTEQFPGDPQHETYRKQYNTRPALKILPALRPRERTPGAQRP